MIGYTCVGTNDLARATVFYDSLFAMLGASHFFEMDRGIGWGTKPGKPMFCVMRPFDTKAATVGNGDMVALLAKDADQVEALHAKALALGGVDEGAPGLRGDDFYGAYFRDLDGNKLAAYCMLPAST
jgi:predicted lactoylglutathione lyase